MKIKFLGQIDYLECFQAMKNFTDNRDSETQDEIWICEHFPVFTQGLAGKDEHLLIRTEIPVIKTNRGGQITFHGLGQIVAYPLINLKKKNYFVKEFVFRLEEAIIKTLKNFQIESQRVKNSPGIYVKFNNKNEIFNNLAKIAALGIKVSKSCTYHGLSLNVKMNLEPFNFINPCGYSGLKTIDMNSLGSSASWLEVANILVENLQKTLEN